MTSKAIRQSIDRRVVLKGATLATMAAAIPATLAAAAAIAGAAASLDPIFALIAERDRFRALSRVADEREADIQKRWNFDGTLPTIDFGRPEFAVMAEGREIDAARDGKQITRGEIEEFNKLTEHWPLSSDLTPIMEAAARSMKLAWRDTAAAGDVLIAAGERLKGLQIPSQAAKAKRRKARCEGKGAACLVGRRARAGFAKPMMLPGITPRSWKASGLGNRLAMPSPPCARPFPSQWPGQWRSSAKPCAKSGSTIATPTGCSMPMSWTSKITPSSTPTPRWRGSCQRAVRHERRDRRLGRRPHRQGGNGGGQDGRRDRGLAARRRDGAAAIERAMQSPEWQRTDRASALDTLQCAIRAIMRDRVLIAATLARCAALRLERVESGNITLEGDLATAGRRASAWKGVQTRERNQKARELAAQADQPTPG